MKNYYIISAIFLSVFFLNISVLSAQQTNDNKRLGYIAFDKLIGIQNTSLYQGTLYTEKYRTINERKQFFKSIQFLQGDVWYNGEPYFNQRVKYNVYDDELLLKLEEKGGSHTLNLYKTAIDSFTIDTHRFINLKPTLITNDIEPGFYEVMFQGGALDFYLKHRKRYLEKKGDRSIHYEFADLKSTYVIFHNGTHYILNSKKTLTRLFPNQKRQINEFYKQAKKIHGNNIDLVMITLVEQLNTILLN